MADSIDLFSQIATIISTKETTHPVRVAIDGIDASGKTTFADALVDPLIKLGRPVIRASIDGFHNPRSTRHSRGQLSPEGYYYDSFNYSALTTMLLKPLGGEGKRNYHTQVFDYKKDEEISDEERVAPINAVLLFDGVFLLRPELKGMWDITIYLYITFDTSLNRAIQRDSESMGGRESVIERYEKRYLPGQKLYHEVCQPDKRAEFIIMNDDPSYPILMINR